MKRIPFLILLAIMVGSVSCSEIGSNASQSDYSFVTSDNATRGSDSYVVKQEDIESYIEFKRLLSKDESFLVRSVVSFPNEDNRTAFIINYEDSWEMISNDKRTPAVLAEGPGLFVKEEVNSAALCWMEDMANAISSMSDNPEITEEQRDNYMFWQLITCDDKLLNDETRIVLPFPPPFGYHLVSIDSTMIYYDAIPHLITTHWGQDEPYNQYCPFKYGTYTRARAGCIAVAGAQMLFYLNQQYDVPETAPDTASCEGYTYYEVEYYNNHNLTYPIPYQMNQWRFRSLSWVRMATSDYLAISAFIANIGTEANLIYYYDGTGGDPVLLNNNVFANVYEVGTSYDTYDENTILDLLQYYNMPTIVAGGGGNGKHVFIIDRYKISQTKYMFTYEENNPSSGGQPLTMRIYTYSSPYVSHFGMNWGEAGNYDDDWFLIEGSWILENSNYASNRMMITFDTDFGQ